MAHVKAQARLSPVLEDQLTPPASALTSACPGEARGVRQQPHPCLLGSTMRASAKEGSKTPAAWTEPQIPSGRHRGHQDHPMGPTALGREASL